MENISQTVEGHKDMAGDEKAAIIERFGLISFGSEGELSPELIDDALESTVVFYNTIDAADIARRIKANKDRYRSLALHRNLCYNYFRFDSSIFRSNRV